MAGGRFEKDGLKEGIRDIFGTRLADRDVSPPPPGMGMLLDLLTTGHWSDEAPSTASCFILQVDCHAVRLSYTRPTGTMRFPSVPFVASRGFPMGIPDLLVVI